MKAELMPLEGKYYGTLIKVTDGKEEISFKLWNSADFKPSDRELESCGVTREQYENNEIVGREKLGNEEWEVTAREQCEICDSHFESEWTYKLALKLVDAINSI